MVEAADLMGGGRATSTWPQCEFIGDIGRMHPYEIGAKSNSGLMTKPGNPRHEREAQYDLLQGQSARGEGELISVWRSPTAPF